MKNPISYLRSDTGAAGIGLVLAVAIAIVTYVVMASQGAEHVLAVAVGFAVFLVVGGSAHLGGRRRRSS